MKSKFLIILCFIAIVSCDSSSDDSSIVDPVEVSDDFKLLSVTDIGEIFSIGNNTGEVSIIGNLDLQRSASLLSNTNITASSESIYGIEYVYDPGPTNNLLMFNRNTRLASRMVISLPNTIPGNERGIIAMTYNGSGLTAVVTEDIFRARATKHVVDINLQTNIATDTGITFNEDVLTSIRQIDNKLYISTNNEGFLEINLTDNSVIKPVFNSSNNAEGNGVRLAVIDNNKLAILNRVSNNGGRLAPALINISNKTITLINTNDTFGLNSSLGGSVYRNNIYFNLIVFNSGEINLLKTNFSTMENTFVRVQENPIRGNAVIIDTFE